MVEGVGETGPQQLESLLTNSNLPPIVMLRIFLQPRAKLSLQYGAIPQRDLSPSGGRLITLDSPIVEKTI